MDIKELIGDVARPIEQGAGSLASGVLKLFGGAPAIETGALQAAHDAAINASAALETASAQAEAEADTILETLADGIVNAGIGAVPGLNMISGIAEAADTEVNKVIVALSDKVTAKVKALLTPKAAAPAAA